MLNKIFRSQIRLCVERRRDRRGVEGLLMIVILNSMASF
jgi:hypothetical protein